MEEDSLEDEATMREPIRGGVTILILGVLVVINVAIMLQNIIAMRDSYLL